jgi:hypothetical protein
MRKNSSSENPEAGNHLEARERLSVKICGIREGDHLRICSFPQHRVVIELNSAKITAAAEDS